jgi:hypothetical protein
MIKTTGIIATLALAAGLTGCSQAVSDDTTELPALKPQVFATSTPPTYAQDPTSVGTPGTPASTSPADVPQDRRVIAGSRAR